MALRYLSVEEIIIGLFEAASLTKNAVALNDSQRLQIPLADKLRVGREQIVDRWG